MDKTSWKIFDSNESTISDIAESCRNAKETIDLEVFIFIPDAFSQELVDICIKKSSEGVRVRFLWDAAGSFSVFNSKSVIDIKKSGIELRYFRTLFPGFLRAHQYKSWYLRNHRRTIVIDNKIGYTGSLCIDQRMKDWRDLNLKIEGPVVSDMSDEFERMWNRSLSNKKIKRVSSVNDTNFKYITNAPFPRQRRLYIHVLEMLEFAKKKINISTPYLVPTYHIVKSLRKASKRGVNVSITIPEWSDHSIADFCSRTYFTTLLKSNIKIFLYSGKMIHSKHINIDDYYASVGTLNIDHVALLYNFEANIVSFDKDFANEVDKRYKEDLLKSRELTLEKWESRPFHLKIAEFFARFIRVFF